MSFTKTINILYSTAFVCFVAYLSFSYRFAFNYETHLNQQYALVSILPIVEIVLIWLYTQRNNYGYSLYNGLLLIGCFSLLLCFSAFYTFANEYFFTLGIITLTSYCLYWLKSIKTVKVIILIFIVVFFFQLYTGLQQIFDKEHPLAISGSLQNSGVFSYYLVCVLSLTYWLILTFCKHLSYPSWAKYLSWISRFILLLIPVLVFNLVCHAQCRTATISFIVRMRFLVVHHYRINIVAIIKSIPNRQMFVLGLISITTLIKLSAIGRLFRILLHFQTIP